MRSSLFVLALAAPLSAQQGLTAHPQESVQTSVFDAVTFGCVIVGPTSNPIINSEARTQILVPSEELPAFAVLLGIELNPSGTPLTYGLLQIDASPTTAAALSMDFATNITTPPTTVLQATNVTVPWNSGAWVAIQFTQPYVHDGVSSLLLDIRKVVSPLPPASIGFSGVSASSLPARTDRPRMVFAHGGPGSGMAMATIPTRSGGPPNFRLQWAAVASPTVRHRSDTGPGANQYAIGGSVDITVQGTAGSLYLMQIGAGFLTVPVTVPGVAGLQRVNGVTFALGFLNAGGQALHLINIPNNPGLAGLHVAYQGAALDMATGSASFTNGMDHFVNP